jgi:hypothetical protein
VTKSVFVYFHTQKTCGLGAIAAPIKFDLNKNKIISYILKFNFRQGAHPKASNKKKELKEDTKKFPIYCQSTVDTRPSGVSL